MVLLLKLNWARRISPLPSGQLVSSPPWSPTVMIHQELELFSKSPPKKIFKSLQGNFVIWYNSHFFLSSSFIFRITDWLQDEMFDQVMLPMGDLAYHLAIKPVVALSVEGDGILCREGLPLDLEEITHPCNILPKHEQWSLVYELFYILDPNVRFKTILAGSRDPLMMLGECLQRFVDELLDHRVCLQCKYPPWVYSVFLTIMDFSKLFCLEHFKNWMLNPLVLLKPPTFVLFNMKSSVFKKSIRRRLSFSSITSSKKLFC